MASCRCARRAAARNLSNGNSAVRFPAAPPSSAKNTCTTRKATAAATARTAGGVVIKSLPSTAAHGLEQYRAFRIAFFHRAAQPAYQDGDAGPERVGGSSMRAVRLIERDASLVAGVGNRSNSALVGGMRAIIVLQAPPLPTELPTVAREHIAIAEVEPAPELRRSTDRMRARRARGFADLRSRRHVGVAVFFVMNAFDTGGFAVGNALIAQLALR